MDISVNVHTLHTSGLRFVFLRTGNFFGEMITAKVGMSLAYTHTHIHTYIHTYILHTYINTYVHTKYTNIYMHSYIEAT